MKKLMPHALAICCGLLLYAFRLPMPVNRPFSPYSTDTTGPLTLTAANPLTIRLYRDSLSTRPANIRLEWQLLLNGIPRQKGVLPTLPLLHGRPTPVRLPIRLPPGNEEAWVRIAIFPFAAGPFANRPGAPALYIQSLRLRDWHPDNTILPAGELAFADSNGLFTITAPNAAVQFDKQTGWLLHYEAGHVLLMGDPLQPLLWDTAIQPRLQLFSTSTGSQMVIVRAEYTIPEMSCLLHLSYTINAAGDMLIGQSLEADSTRQNGPLPHFAMRWQLPAGLDSATCFGTPADPGAAGSIDPTDHPRPTDPGPTGHTTDSTTAPVIYHLPVMDQREQTWSGVRWLSLTSRDGKGLQITADSALLELHAASDSAHTANRHLDIGLPQPSPLPYGSYQYTWKINPTIARPPVSTAPPPNRKPGR